MAEFSGDPDFGAVRAQESFRHGYRTGFGDGYAQASRPPAPDGGGQSGGKKPDQKEAGKSGDDKGSDEKKDGDPKDADKKEGDKDAKPDDPKKTPIYKRPLAVLIAIVVILALVIAAFLFWRHSRKHESTDDAFIDGQASRIAAQAPGRVTRLYITDNEEVKAGQPLLEIDASDIQARVDQARAQVATAESQIAQAEAQVDVARANANQSEASVRQAEADATRTAQDLIRFQRVDPDAVSRRQADTALADARSARARLDAARSAARGANAQIKSALAQVQVARAGIDTARASQSAADLQLSYAHVVAPITGRVTRRSVDVGNVISVGQALLSIVSRDLWVTANYKETQLTEMRVGQVVNVTVDAFPDVNFTAHVDSIQRGTGGFFSLLPAENATGNYVKVVQRVPVKIVFDRPEDLTHYPIGPGMSVTPDVQLR